MSTKIGCDNLVYAVLTDDTETWAAPKAATGVQSVTINANPSQETNFYDDGPGEVAATLGKIEVEIQKNELTTTQKADFLGHAIDANGGLVYGASDTAPWLAIGFRTLKGNGKYRYVWLYKGKFMEPEDKNETKGDSVNFQNETIKGMFVKLNKKYKVAADKTVQPWKYEMDEEHSTADSATIAAWFTAVVEPEVVA